MKDFPVERYDEMQPHQTAARIIKRMTDPVEIEKRRQEKEEKEYSQLQAKRIGL